MVFEKEVLPDDCYWILPFIGEPKIIATGKKIVLSIEADNVGDWIAVNVISAKRANFFHSPDLSAIKRAFLVAGDVVYIYRELADWYFVKYRGAKFTTEGWIRKTDTNQLR